MSVADEIFELFRTRGQDAYYGENVSILEHSLQTAWFAHRSSAARCLVVAALVHDIGHLLHGLPENVANQGIDGRHELAGESWLRSRFAPEVTEPVRLHVEAKRYLCYADSGYSGRLSPSSMQSLALQGGVHSGDEAREFERNAYFRDAIALRRWDDAAKIPGLGVPDLGAYRNALDGLVLQAPR